jgi:hypothetical protein
LRSRDLRTTVLAIAAAAGAALGAPPAGAAVEIAPHRALYEIRLSGVSSGAQVTGVSGRMGFEWGDACDGWTVQQRFQLRFQYADGNAVEMVTSYATWEAKDGGAYRFNVRRMVNGETEEEVRGEADLRRDGSGGVVRYVRPEASEDALPPGTMFPSAHTIALIETAKADGRFHASVVFDGSDTEGATELTTAIALGHPPRARLSGPGGSLLVGTAWPMRLAFFPREPGGAEPEYEMGLSLLDNGVAESLEIDYGEFRVSGRLVDLEALPRPRC